MQLYLFTLCPSAANSSQAQIIDMFCSSYNHARHHPAVSSSALLSISLQKVGIILFSEVENQYYTMLFIVKDKVF